MLFTTDSDAPNSKRVMYIGTDNVAAGVQAGELIKKALPNGGKIMLFVGTMGAANARERVEGIKKAIAGTKVEIIDIRTDEVDFATRQAQRRGHADQVSGHRRAGRPLVLQHAADLKAVQAAGKEGKVKIIGFDEDPVTLRGIADGIDRRHRGPAALRVRLPVDDLTWPRYIEGDKSVIPANEPEHHPDQDHRQVQRRRVRSADEGAR